MTELRSLQDYDPAVLAAIQTNIAANFSEDERKPATGPQCSCIRKTNLESHK